MEKWVRNSFFQSIYSSLAGMKNWTYDHGLLKTVQLKTPVISVGNLTVGGTGKTPMIRHLVQYALQKGLKPVIVSRNYKAESQCIQRVDINHEKASQYFGDEPTLLASIFPDVSVYVGPTKWMTALEAEKRESPDVIFVDDGFQHRNLHRNFDLVLLDATVNLQDYELLPVGKARESIRSLKRAHWICITKSNLVNFEKINSLKELMGTQGHILKMNYQVEIPQTVHGQKALAFCGLGQPDSFYQSLRQTQQIDLKETVSFPDHYLYTQKDIEILMNKKNEIQADCILTTEKDWVKIQKLSIDLKSIFHVGLKTELQGPLGEFYVHLDKVLGCNH
ncbi:MAG: tetraacyldisaccharide 4'-kinase [Oligoflexia bacterium]|nr:MAG: tetraacyldisaccharide 4'-kinase [Oligoflexia bacterium]